MKVVAVVPIKMNNVRTPGKNTKLLCDGTPLIQMILKSLLSSKEIDEIYVYCSNPDIKNYLLPNVQYISRDPKYDTPDADVIDMMKTFSEMINADLYVQVHATTPFLKSTSISKAINMLKNGEYDSAFAVTKLQDFIWENSMPLNYSLEKIPRTQDMKPLYKETTGLYIYNKSVIQNLSRRIGNKPYLLEVSEIEAIDIDTPEDFDIANAVYSFLVKGEQP